MNYSDALQKAKSERRDHRKAKSVATSVERRKRVRDSKDFITVEREHDPLGRFGGSLKSVYYDSDGDSYKDSYGRSYRSGVVNKPGVIIPSFGPIIAPVSGPSNLNTEETFLAPASGPSTLDASLKVPVSGPSTLDTSIEAPASGPSTVETTVNVPLAGPSNLNAVEGIPNAPAAGPSTLNTNIPAPASGPSTLNTNIPAPASGPSTLNTNIPAPASGPSTLNTSLSVPASGPSTLDASITAPASGPTGLSTALATLNINIEASQDTIVAKTAEPAGTIEYASDVGYLFIYDGTDWQRTNGGNS